MDIANEGKQKGRREAGKDTREGEAEDGDEEEGGMVGGRGGPEYIFLPRNLLELTE
jgi:hypothetical protein